MITGYFTVKSEGKSVIKDRGSRFLGYAFPLYDEAAVKVILTGLKKEHSQAVHHCYAYRLNNDGKLVKSSDDREPSGTAGKPILNAILSANITYTLIIVVRYFGGSLLGVPGLIRAYGQAASEAIEDAGIIQKEVFSKIRITVPYEFQHEVYAYIRSVNGNIVSTESGNEPSIIFEIPVKQLEITEQKFKSHDVLSFRSKWKIL